MFSSSSEFAHDIKHIANTFKHRVTALRRRKIGLLLDSLSNNTGDRAILAVMVDFLKENPINYEVVNPLSFDPEKYSRLIIGGGDLIQPPSPYYDIFRQRGHHLLNAVGVNSNSHLEYLSSFDYLSVRSEGDAQVLRSFGLQPEVVPCVSMMLKPEPVELTIPENAIGLHFHSVSFSKAPEISHVMTRFADYPVVFIPFTHYNNDAGTMQVVAKRIPQSIFIGQYEPAELLWITGKLKAFVCSSLHAAIFAYINNVPFLVYPYSAKILRFLKDRGLERLTFTNSQELQAKLSEILTHPPEFGELYKSDVARIERHLLTLAEIATTTPGGGTAPARRKVTLEKSDYTAHVVRQKDADMHYLETQIDELVDENWHLRRKSLARLSVHEAIPQQFRTGRLFSILIASAKTIKEEGPTIFAMKSLRKIRNRQFHIIQEIDYPVPDWDYAEWIRRTEPRFQDLATQRTEFFAYSPLISIITPVWNPPPKVLLETIRSVEEQTYANWELCLADGGSNHQVRKILLESEQRDRRIRVRLLDRNFGISGNSNAAIQYARGEFIAFLDHDDELAPSALYEVVCALNKDNKIDFIYSDKDKLTLTGKRFAPLFKPDWSPEIMFSANYVTHLCAVRSSVLKKVAGFREETDGAQDWDLFLRIADATKRIHHIPKVLYHWRLVPASVSAHGIEAKPYATKAQLTALNHHLTSQHIAGGIQFNDFGHPRIQWHNPGSAKLSVITFCRNRKELETFLSSFTKSHEPYLEVLPICAGEAQGLTQLEQRFSKVRMIDAEWKNYAQAYNVGSHQSNGDILVFMDPSLQPVKEGWLAELTGWAVQPSIGIVGAQLLSSTGRMLHQGIVLGLSGFLFDGACEGATSALGHTEWYRNTTAVTGACMATRRDLFAELGGFAEKSASADIDLCLKVWKRNLRVVCTPEAKLLLPEKSKWSSELSHANRRSHKKRDSYFNENLSLDHTIPTIDLTMPGK